jgi:hypothetical protein
VSGLLNFDEEQFRMRIFFASIAALALLRNARYSAQRWPQGPAAKAVEGQ